MKPVKLYIFLFFTVLISAGSRCHKTDINPCTGKTQPDGKFLIKEMIGDTAFTADTIFRDNYVQFQALNSYESVSWKFGSDQRAFTDSSFSLSFITALGTLPVNFTGKKTPNTMCFPGDKGTYSSTQNLTIVEQVEKPILSVSPLVGRYKGYYTDNPSDTFTVSIQYLDSVKYDVSMTGSKNFYLLSNFPKGFIDSTTNKSYSYPEFRNGFQLEMGYKCYVFQWGQFNGKGWLSHDSLYSYHTTNFVNRRNFIGKKL